MRRAGTAGVALGLDFAAVMAIGEALEADLELLAETLPDFEFAVVTALNEAADEGDSD